MAFTLANRSGTTLRSILESALIPKVFFDVRNDSDALYAHFNISLQGVHDIQLLEVATRPYSRDRVFGLKHCIQTDAQLSAGEKLLWKAKKETGRALFAAEKGGSYEVFNVRPIIPDIINYCTQDVELLPVLWDVYSHRINAKWLRRVQEETQKRVLMSKDESYDPHGEGKALSPWASEVKGGKKIISRKTGVRETEKKGTRGMREIEKKKPSAAEVSTAKAAHQQARKQLFADLRDLLLVANDDPQPSSSVAGSRTAQAIATGNLDVRDTREKKPSAAEVRAAKAAHRQAEKQLVADLIDRSLVGNNDPQSSTVIAEPRGAAQAASTVADTMLAHSSPRTELPTRSKTAAHGKVVAKTDIKGSPAAKDFNWTCEICGRTMPEISQQDHLAGKAHIARLNRASKAASKTPLPSTSTKGKFAQAATKNTKKSQKAKFKPPAKHQQSNPSKVGSASTKSRNGAPTMATCYPYFFARPYTDWDFIDSEQTEYTTSSSYLDYYLGGGEDYGLCDKECGWCGHCMDGVDI